MLNATVIDYQNGSYRLNFMQSYVINGKIETYYIASASHVGWPALSLGR
jgi:hypothetical protein